LSNVDKMISYKNTEHNRIIGFERNPLRIAVCPPDLNYMQKVYRGEPADATSLIQSYIARGLSARGYTISYVIPQNSHQTLCTPDILQPKLALQSWSASHWFEFSRKLTWSIQRSLGIPYLNVFSNLGLMDACLRCLPGHDLVYERNSLYRFGIAMACKRLGIPYVLYFEADDILEHDIMGKPLKGLLRWQARKALCYNLSTANCIICVSESGKAQLVKNWNVPAKKIVVFPNVADTKRFMPELDTRSEVRESLKKKDQPIVIFSGNFYQWHDVTTLLKAFLQVIANHPSAHLVLLGDGENRLSMMKLAADLKLSQSVTFTGMVPHEEVPRFLTAADIGVVPYPAMDTELWLSPLKLFEYMASGLAVIASNAGQLCEVIRDGYNGLLVPPGDELGMASAINRLIENPTLRTQLGIRARQDAVEKHSWEQYITRLEDLFYATFKGDPVHQI
jgi:glycosyltransferase involved in cell wall biosynthesis